MELTLRPFPADALPLLWEWLNEFPKANFDDTGPRTLAAFQEEMLKRAIVGEVLIAAMQDGDPVGMIGYVPLVGRTGLLRGICFSKAVHGTPTTKESLRLFFRALTEDGVRKVSASYFAHNHRIRKFLKSLGFVDEGYLRQHTVQEGKPIDCRLVAKFLATLTDGPLSPLIQAVDESAEGVVH